MPIKRYHSFVSFGNNQYVQDTSTDFIWRIKKTLAFKPDFFSNKDVKILKIEVRSYLYTNTELANMPTVDLFLTRNIDDLFSSDIFTNPWKISFAATSFKNTDNIIYHTSSYNFSNVWKSNNLYTAAPKEVFENVGYPYEVFKYGERLALNLIIEDTNQDPDYTGLSVQSIGCGVEQIFTVLED